MRHGQSTVILALLVYYCVASTQASSPGAGKSPAPGVGTSPGLSNPLTEARQTTGSEPESRKLAIVDVAKIVNHISRNESDKYDYSMTILDDKSASVHIHALGFSQTTPLHLHHTSEEATIIVSGKPHVTQFFGKNGKVEKLEGDYAPGTLIYSPRLCGHKWVNPSKQTMQVNLVIASPPFKGNFYVDPTDSKFKGSEPALISRPGDEFQRWLRASQAPFQAEKLPMMNGKMLRLLLRKQVHLPPSASATILYVLEGNGILVAGQSHLLAPQNVALIPPQHDITLEANQNAPLLVIAFRPEATWESLPTR